MANNYTQFSFAVALKTPEEREWAERVVAYLATVHEAEQIDEAHEFFPLLNEDQIDNEYLGYDVEVDTDGLWFATEESGTPDHVVPVVQAYLTKFAPTECVGFEWADWCSKPRLDEFGGGACFITADNVEYMNTGTWVLQQIKAHDEQRKAKEA